MPAIVAGTVALARPRLAGAGAGVSSSQAELLFVPLGTTALFATAVPVVGRSATWMTFAQWFAG